MLQPTILQTTLQVSPPVVCHSQVAMCCVGVMTHLCTSGTHSRISIMVMLTTEDKEKTQPHAHFSETKVILN